MEETPCYIIDAFTEHKFGGNPAAVCFFPAPLDDASYLRIAAELNLSETAFPLPLLDNDNLLEQHAPVAEKARRAEHFTLRWFTPTQEVPLCGHATLATAHAIFNELGNDKDSLTFATNSGTLQVRRMHDSQFEMDFPAYEIAELITTKSQPASNNPMFPMLEDVEGIGERIANKLVGDGNWTNLAYAKQAKKLLVVIDSSISRSDFERIYNPRGSKLLELDPTSRMVKGVILTLAPASARSQGYVSPAGEEEVDYVCRYFAPWVGIDEDPATGSAQCALANYWFKRLAKVAPLRGMQCFPGRGANFVVQLSPDFKRVKLRGKAITFMRGSVHI